MASLELADVVKSYAGNTVLRSVSLDVKDGEFISLLGPSGCGKTTTLNIVAGFVAADAGRVFIAGQDVSRVPPYRRDSSIVFQNYALFPHMKVWANVAYGLKARRLDKREVADRVGAALELLSIADLADRYPAQLSGGQQQRVAVARAVVVRPGVLLMDEPLSNLDVKLRQEIRLELRELQRELGQTILFVTHDQEEALALSDRVAVMNEGVIEQMGTPEEIYREPTTVFVADFMGVENIFPVHRNGSGTIVGESLAVPGSTRIRSEHVGIRPTAVRLFSDGEPAGPADADGAVTARGVVSSQTYLGNTVRYDVAVADSADRVVVEAPYAESRPQQGDNVRVVLPLDSLLELDSAAGGDVDEHTGDNEKT
jgi:ABC-type Fe3+/spermidine/putrescine transport system ATPase subunit